MTPAAGLPYNFDPTDVSSGSIRLDQDWENPTLIVNGYDVTKPQVPFKLPFLSGSDQGIFLEFVSLTPHLKETDPYFDVQIKATVKVGDLSLETMLDLEFHYEHFAFKIVDKDGIKLHCSEPIHGSFKGLEWRFLGPGGALKDFDFLRLVIDGSNYQLRQEPGTTFEVDYSAATKEGSAITFSIQDFLIGPKGIDLSATVTNRPAKLAGIDTEFSFRQGSFQIRQNQITGFSLTGSGPLPPALVGSATAEISLQFEQDQGGGLSLISGGAKLEGKNLLKCQGTRFQFTVDAIGLKFVKDAGRYHLYFTITGTATYNPLASDDSSGPLSWLPKIEMKLMECPLTGDASVISQHVEFLIEMPKKAQFDFLGCFQFELRAIGFVPQARMFEDKTSAMRISGQIKFADGGGDALDARIDLHDLYIALPSPGSLLPRLYCKRLGVKIQSGEAFVLDGYVDFLNDEVVDGLKVNGFRGGGSVAISGIKMAAAFSFVRVLDDTGDWKRAWFIYLELREISIQIPVVELFIREIGLGFGYRYTLASIKATDNVSDPKQLIAKLKELSLTQGDLANQNQWRIDAGGPDDPRWTVVFKGMIAESSASETVLDWYPKEEQELPCLFLMDVVVALRSDLTFLMTARAWLSTNYWEYDNDQPAGIRDSPLLAGFVLLSPRQKRFLAHVNSNPNAKFGKLPPLGFLQEVLTQCYFTATILMEPGLLQYELGWPNQLRWGAPLGPLNAEFRGGTLFRLSSTELVIGNSFEARGTLQLQAGIDLGFIGARLSALASVAYGARYIGVIAFDKPFEKSAFYGVAGIDIQVTVSVAFWIKIDLGWFGSITINFGFSFAIAITAAIQVGITFKADFPMGVRGTATIALSIMGHGLQFNVCVGINDQAVSFAQGITQRFLDVGLEATDVQPIPGETRAQQAAVPPASHNGNGNPAHSIMAPPPSSPMLGLEGPPSQVHPTQVGAPPPAVFQTPDYSIFLIPKNPSSNDSNYDLFVLVPSALRENGTLGFLPVPPADGATVTNDFSWTLPVGTANLERYNPVNPIVANNPWDSQPGLTWEWKANWDWEIGKCDSQVPAGAPVPRVTPQTFLRYAYLYNEKQPPSFGGVEPTGDPVWQPQDQDQTEDARVYDPSDSSYEASVRGAADQVEGAKFKHDPNSPYDVKLAQAFDLRTSIYATDGVIQNPDGDLPKPSDPPTAHLKEEQAVQTRSSVIHSLIQDLQDYAVNPAQFEAKVAVPGWQVPRSKIDASLAFQMGLVFRAPADTVPWLNSGSAGEILQRSATGDPDVDPNQHGHVTVFNTVATQFDRHVPYFERVHHYADASSIWITWDLEWDWSGSWAGQKPRVSNQSDPDHHLKYYVIRRRRLDGVDNGVEFRVKPADVLHRDCQVDQAGNPVTGPDTNKIYRLRSRFQINDHFNNETAQDLADLPPDGKTYLYTITPVDLAGNSSPRPLTVVATRKSNEPPRIPSDIELTVKYKLPATMPDPAKTPLLQSVDSLKVAWTEPPASTNGPNVVPKHAATCLVFRRESTEPIGSYGVDASAVGARADGLPTSNARALATDLIVPLNAPDPTSGTPGRRFATVDPVKMGQAGIPLDGAWRPDSWRIFLRRESFAGVRSALAPVQVVLEFDGSSVQPEIKRPGNLEFIAQPVAFSFLPPEDERADSGPACVPLRSLGDWNFKSDPLPTFDFEPHPNGSRAIHFLWNQASTRPGAYPPDLHSGYRVYEYDLDANTAQPIDSHKSKSVADFTDRLRLIQEVELLSAADAQLTPSDTLSTSKWEAWYPATVRRRDIALKQKMKVDYSPWFTWRESAVIWPSPDFAGSMFDPQSGRRTAKYHPLLKKIIDDLSPVPINKTDPQFVVDLSPLPPAKPSNLEDFLAATAPAADPYGWKILQLCGLSICFCRRNKTTGVAESGADTIAAITEVIKQYSGADWEKLRQHLHVEILVEPGRSIRVVNDTLKAGDFLAIVQLSLRPVIRQVYRYGSLQIQASPGQTEFAVELNGETDCTILTSLSPVQEVHLQADGKLVLGIPAAGKLLIAVRALRPDLIRLKDPNGVELRFTGFQPDDQDALYSFDGNPRSPVSLSVTLGSGASCVILDPVTLSTLAQFTQTGSFAFTIPAGGTMQFLVRSEQIEAVTVADPAGKAMKYTPQFPSVANYFSVDLDAWTNQFLAREASFSFTATANSSVKLPVTLSKGARCTILDPVTRTVLASLEQTGTVLFSVPASGAVKFLVRYNQRDAVTITGPDQKQLQPVDTLPDGLSNQWDLLWKYLQSLNSSNPKLPQIQAPDLSNSQGAADLEPVLSWMQRFLDLGQLKTTPGVWIAAAYQRLVSPVAAVPDPAGRVEYYHVITDQWAHTFRYYILPQGRYDKLWRSLFPNQSSALVDPRPKDSHGLPEMGGLDVVLDRVKEVAPPLILSSKRIDPNSEVSQPAKPGAVWEVIVAKHPEQILIERNQTLVRHLSYRQIAVTLLRRFAYGPDLTNFKNAAGALIIAPVVADRTVALLPKTYPPPDILDFTQEQNIRAIDLPLRIGDFSRGALVYQWRGLPYFYEQRFIAVAQTTIKASDPVEVLQRDFEYVSPQPSAEADAEPGVNGGARHRLIRIRLSSYWDCVPLSTRQQWPQEDPTADDMPARKYSSLPDVHVVYQLFFTSVGGATETILEVTFGSDYVVKAVSTAFNAEKVSIVQANRPPLKQPVYFLSTRLKQNLSLALVRGTPPTIDGDFSRVDRNRILYPSIPEFSAIETWPGDKWPGDSTLAQPVAEFLARWYAVRAISGPADLAPYPNLAAKIAFVRSDRLILLWFGNSAGLNLLDVLAAASDDDLKPALTAMSAELHAGKAFSIQTAPLPFPAHLPSELTEPGSLQLQLDRVLWKGVVLPGQTAALDALQKGLKPHSSALAAVLKLRDSLRTAGPYPAQPHIFTVPTGGLGNLVQLMANPLAGLKTENLPNAMCRLTWTGADNVGASVDTLSAQLPVAFPDATDPRRVALAAIFAELSAFQTEVPFLTIPPGLSGSLAYECWLIKCSQALTQDDRDDLLALYPVDQTKPSPDQASLKRLFDDLSDLQTVDSALKDWTSEQAISSSADFLSVSAQWHERYEFPAPDSCVLTIISGRALSDDESRALLALDADVSFQEALRKLVSGSSTAEATLGLEQISEISTTVGLPTAGNRTLTWHGTASPSQFLTLDRWRKISSFKTTFDGLYMGIRDWTFALSQEVNPVDLPFALQSHIQTGQWTGLNISPEVSAALLDAIGDSFLSPGAVQSLKDLAAALDTAVLTIPVEDSWKPRPGRAQFPASLNDILLIGRGRIRYYGLMTTDEAAFLTGQTGLSIPNRDAIGRLFADSTSAGLQGGKLKIGARLGSAAVNSGDLTAILTAGGGHA